MRHGATADAAATSFIDPARLYTLNGFIRDSGTSGSRMRDAAKKGVKLTKLRVGRRVYVRGADAIEFIEKLAALSDAS